MPAKKSPQNKISTGARSFLPPAGSAKSIQVISVKGDIPRKKYTGRWLVRLDPAVAIATVEKQAQEKNLKLKTLDGDESLQSALKQNDGVIFPLLRIALVNGTGINELQTLQAVAGNAFLSIEQERYCYSFQALSKERPIKDTSTVSWGIAATNVEKNAYTGKGVKLAVLDTGFDFSHPDFSGRTIHKKSFVGTRQADDKEGHGTHCAAIAAGGRKGKTGLRYGVASGAQLYVGKILDDNGEGTDAQILAGVEWALEKGCRIISLSLGTPLHAEDGWSEVFEQVGRIVIANDCLLIAAAGNDSERGKKKLYPVCHPANCPSILAVAALTPLLDVADYSCASPGYTTASRASAVNVGQVDIAAPGDNILSAWPGGKHRRQSGTSMATPFVSGIAALLWEEYPDASPGDIWARLTQQARRLPLAASDIGAGLVHV